MGAGDKTKASAGIEIRKKSIKLQPFSHKDEDVRLVPEKLPTLKHHAVACASKTLESGRDASFISRGDALSSIRDRTLPYNTTTIEYEVRRQGYGQITLQCYYWEYKA